MPGDLFGQEGMVNMARSRCTRERGQDGAAVAMRAEHLGGGAQLGADCADAIRLGHSPARRQVRRYPEQDGERSAGGNQSAARAATHLNMAFASKTPTFAHFAKESI